MEKGEKNVACRDTFALPYKYFSRDFVCKNFAPIKVIYFCFKLKTMAKSNKFPPANFTFYLHIKRSFLFNEDISWKSE